MRRSAAALFVLTLASSALAAPTKEECVDANARGQVARKQQHLHVARAAFQTCAVPTCPSVVRRDCEERLADVERSMPTLACEATEEGHAIATATVTLDGAPFGNADKTPHEIDPGPHRFVFHAENRPDVVRDFVVEEGRPQVLTVAFAGRDASAKNTMFRNVGIGLAAVGLAGIIVGAAFGGATFSSWGAVKSECIQAAACDITRATSDRDQALAFSVVSDVGFVAGGVLAVAGAVFLVLGARVVPTVSPRVIGFTVEERF